MRIDKELATKLAMCEWKPGVHGRRRLKFRQSERWLRFSEDATGSQPCGERHACRSPLSGASANAGNSMPSPIITASSNPTSIRGAWELRRALDPGPAWRALHCRLGQSVNRSGSWYGDVHASGRAALLHTQAHRRYGATDSAPARFERAVRKAGRGRPLTASHQELLLTLQSGCCGCFAPIRRSCPSSLAAAVLNA